MVLLTIEKLVKRFRGEKIPRGDARKRAGVEGGRRSPAILAVDDVSLEVAEGEMFTLLGPSGCGKTTTLRSIAGLERPDEGEIRVRDRVLFSSFQGRAAHVPTNKRGLGMVFQSYAIWPHLKVFDNVAFPLQVASRTQRLGKKQIRDRVMSTLASLELEELANRPATKLSGGQQQRLALARALVIEPELLLLDEPLSNLDAKLREALRFELKRFQQEFGITSVYVTHDQVEALALSSRIAVMKGGKIMQVGKPRDIYEKPASQFVAEFIGTTNFIRGRVATTDGGMISVDSDSGRLSTEVIDPPKVGEAVVLAIRPEAIEMETGSSELAASNTWTGQVVARSFLGDSVDHIVAIGATEFFIRSGSRQSVPAGTTVSIHLPISSLNLIPIDD